MNDVLCLFLHRFMLVFFNNILIFSSSWAEHLQDISIVLDALRAHRLHLKHSKCSFGGLLGSVPRPCDFSSGVTMDADKVAAVASWPTPRSTHGLRGFLGLTGYYRKYIHDFGVIAAPLTHLLHKDAFAWSDEADTAFQALKQALSIGPILQMPDFAK
ncbi:uncharacterized mitochondrial protein AtMg00860-like [Miscanthus floridulus]|uniref:uncharacterized mitochondrial protein AtMg00860-like n=1 Tax=Miscanthus floridulus TaxID=154761 RepID=UPI003457E4D2